MNFDGCDSACKIEKDFICEVLPSRLSVCKYNGSIEMVYSHMTKDENVNLVHIYLLILPITVKIWTKQSIQSLLASVKMFKKLSN
jgi:hypothetical protein